MLLNFTSSNDFAIVFLIIVFSVCIIVPFILIMIQKKLKSEKLLKVVKVYTIVSTILTFFTFILIIYSIFTNVNGIHMDTNTNELFRFFYDYVIFGFNNKYLSLGIPFRLVGDVVYLSIVIMIIFIISLLLMKIKKSSIVFNVFKKVLSYIVLFLTIVFTVICFIDIDENVNYGKKTLESQGINLATYNSDVQILKNCLMQDERINKESPELAEFIMLSDISLDDSLKDSTVKLHGINCKVLKLYKESFNMKTIEYYLYVKYGYDYDNYPNYHNYDRERQIYWYFSYYFYDDSYNAEYYYQYFNSKEYYQNAKNEKYNISNNSQTSVLKTLIQLYYDLNEYEHRLIENGTIE